MAPTRADVERWVSRLVGMPCWGVNTSPVGDIEFSLTLGKMIREPAWSHSWWRRRTPTGPDDPRWFRGEAQLYVCESFWRLEFEDEILVTMANVGSRIYDHLPKLEGTTIVEAELGRFVADLRLRFSNGMSLRVLTSHLDAADCDYEGCSHWELRLDDEILQLNIAEPWDIVPYELEKPYCNRHMQM